jgi:hypothetical protein
MQQSPKHRKEEVYTARRPYLTARGTHNRFEIPADAEAVEKSRAVFFTPEENAAVDSGVSVAGLLGSGGYAWKRSITISTKTDPGPPAKKLTHVSAAQVSTAT